MPRKIKIRADELFRVWHKSKTQAEVCRHFNITGSMLRQLMRYHKLPRKPKAPSGKIEAPEPTPEEIEKMTEEIRQGWSPADVRLRLGYKPEGWRAPLYSYNSKVGTFRAEYC